MTSKLILIAGYAGNGKTHFGHLLARVYSAVYVDKDSVSRDFTEALLKSYGGSPHDRESETYIQKVRPLEYQEMMKVATENLRLGKNVICSAPFIKELNDPSWMTELEDSFALMDVSIHVLWIHCDADTAKSRIEQRAAKRDKWKLNNWDSYIEANPHVVPEMSLPLYVIDNKENPVEPLQAQVKRFVNKLGD